MAAIFGPKQPANKPEIPAPPLDPETEEMSEAEKLGAWEFLMLLDLGFSIEQGLALIAVPHFSWHEAERLRKKGMPHALIVAELLP